MSTFRINRTVRGIIIAGVFVGLYFLSRENYLLFHGIVEIFSIIIAFSTFLFVWNSRNFFENHYFLVIGMAYLFVGGLDFLHTLAYRGMGVFDIHDSNLATQLWISARYFEALSILAALFFINRKVKEVPAFSVCLVIFTVLVLSIFQWKIFPVCYVEGSGLTLFKIVNEYVISAILAVAVFLFYRRRKYFTHRTAVILISAMVTTIIAELVFTLYNDVYGISNAAGHFLKFVSFYLIYLAVIETNLHDPLSNMFASLRDTRDNLEQEIKLRGEAEQSYRTSLDKSPLCMHIYTKQGELVYINKAGLDLRGFDSLEEYLDTPPEERMTAKSFAQYTQWNLDRKSGKPLPSHFMMDIVRKDGEIRCLEAFKSEVFWEGEIQDQILFEDVTEKYHAEQLLKESEDRYRQLFDNMSSGVVIHEAIENGDDFIFKGLNKAAETIDNVSRDELTGKRVMEIFPAIREMGLLAVFQRVWRTGNPEYFPIREYQDNRISGWRDSYVYKLPSGEIVTIYDDLTEQKRAEERENKLKEELVTQSRLAAIGQMAAGIAHEINNPLTGVVGYSSLLLDKDIPEDIRTDLQVINDSAQRVASIVRRMLSFAREQDPEMKLTNINSLVESVLEIRSHDMQINNINVIKQLSPDLPETSVDPGQIQQVFLNIILNAEIEMKNANDRGNLTIKTETVDDMIRISFEDNGPGIDENNMDKVFDPFFTTREVGEGTGLGLSVSYGIISRHNGRIYARNMPESGATFIVELPIISDGVQDLPTGPAVDTGIVDNTRILVVDDEVMIGDVLYRILTGAGFMVDCVNTGAQALQLLENREFDVIFLDVRMPGISGIDIFESISKRSATLSKKIVFITGDTMNAETMNYLNSAEIPFIGKPFHPAQVLEIIDHVLKK